MEVSLHSFEVSAFTVVYVLIIEMFVYKDLNLKEIPRVIIDCATLVGGVLIILGVAMGFYKLFS